MAFQEGLLTGIPYYVVLTLVWSFCVTTYTLQQTFILMSYRPTDANAQNRSSVAGRRRLSHPGKSSGTLDQGSSRNLSSDKDLMRKASGLIDLSPISVEVSNRSDADSEAPNSEASPMSPSPGAKAKKDVAFVRGKSNLSRETSQSGRASHEESMGSDDAKHPASPLRHAHRANKPLPLQSTQPPLLHTRPYP